MTNKELMEAYEEHILPTYARFPVAFESGHGATLRFRWPGIYRLLQRIRRQLHRIRKRKMARRRVRQAGTLQHTSNLFYTAPALELARRLTEATGMGGVFFGNSGAEANEGIIKLPQIQLRQIWSGARQHRHIEKLLSRADHHHPQGHGTGEIP